MSIGYVLAILTGIFYGLQGVVGKWVVRDTPPVASAWAVTTFTVPFLAVLLLVQGMPTVNPLPFWSATFTSYAVNLLAWTLFFKSLQLSSIALTMPYTALTPLFIIPVSYLLLGEIPSTPGVGGILLIILGAYGLQIPPGQWYQPIRGLFQDKGTRLMIGVAALWSVSATVEKVAVVNSSPLFYGVVINSLLGATYTLYLIIRHPMVFRGRGNGWMRFGLLGLVSAAMVVVQFYALLHLFVSYVIAFKRAGVLVSVLLGYFLFREKGIIRHLLFSLLMILGAYLIMAGG